MVLAGLALATAAGCATAPPPPVSKVEIPVEDTTPQQPKREPPPDSGAARDYRFPKVTWAELPNGLKLATIQSKALPIVQIRVVVPGGKAADGEKPGLAGLTAQLLKDGGSGRMSSRDLLTRIESLGADLTLSTSFEATDLGLAVTKDHLGEALELLGAIVHKPQFSAGEFDKLRKRLGEAAADTARSNGRWGTSMVLYRDLFTLPSEHHPYATYAATASEIARLKVEDCRAYHKRFFVPKNTFVVVVGDTTPEAAKTAVEKAFKDYRGGEPPVLSFTEPNGPEHRRITLVDRPKSSQSDVVVGFLGPERSDRSWASFAVANQILGGGVSSRLFADVREKQSLAYSTNSHVSELSHGPSVFMAFAGTQTAKTGLALQGLLENLERLATTVPSDEEVETATRYLADSFALRRESVNAIANELIHVHLRGLPDDYDDGYRKELREITGPLAGKAAGDRFRMGHEVIVVSGDAAVVGPMLSHFGEVKVLDPTKDFARIRTIPMDAAAPLEVPRETGK